MARDQALLGRTVQEFFQRTRAFCLNLVTSVHSGGRYIVAFVIGGHSSFERDAHMRELISLHIKQALSPWQWVGRCQA
jgi:hypothetical protein